MDTGLNSTLNLGQAIAITGSAAAGIKALLFAVEMDNATRKDNSTAVQSGKYMKRERKLNATHFSWESKYIDDGVRGNVFRDVAKKSNYFRGELALGYTVVAIVLGIIAWGLPKLKTSEAPE